MQRSILTTLGILACAGPGLAQSSSTGGSSVATKGISQTEQTEIRYDDRGDVLWARGTTYKASFGAHGAKYIPFLGSHVPRNYPLGLRLTEVSVGGQALETDPAPSLREMDDVVSIDRGSLREVYHLDLTQMEQTFEFDALPGDGDLVLRMAVETELGVEADGGGLLFANQFGGVGYGKATVLDADGDAADAPLEYANGTLSILVPDAFLDVADFPIVVDPIIWTYQIASGGGFLIPLTSKPDTIADSDTHGHYTVYEEQFSGQDRDVALMWSDYTGLHWSSAVTIDATDDDWADPRVAHANVGDKFVAVASVQPQSGGSRRIQARAYDSGAASVGAVETISDAAFSGDMLRPTIGGAEGTNPRLMVAWVKDFNGRVLQTRPVTSSAAPLLTFPVTLNPPAGVEYDNPSLANSASIEPGFTRRWPLVFEGVSGGLPHVRATIIENDGGTQFAPLVIGAAEFTWQEAPSCTSLLDGGGQRLWAMVYQTTQLNQTADVVITTFRDDQQHGSLTVAPSFFDRTSKDQTAPVVTTDGTRIALAYHQTESSSDQDTYIASFGAADSVLCTSEFSSEFAAHSGATSRLSISAAGTVGGLPLRVYLAWQEGNSNPDIEGASYLMPNVICGGDSALCNPAVPNSTGAPARLAVFGSIFAGSDLDFAVENIPAGEFGYILGSMNPGFTTNPGGSAGTLCLSGNIARFNRAGEVQNGGAGGSFQVTLDTSDVPLTPAVAIQAGQSWFFQCWYRDSGTSNFSDGVRIDF